MAHSTFSLRNNHLLQVHPQGLLKDKTLSEATIDVYNAFQKEAPTFSEKTASSSPSDEGQSSASILEPLRHRRGTSSA